MAQDTDTQAAIKDDEKQHSTNNKQAAKDRWFRYSPKHPELPELDKLLDLYWGGPERRISNLTLKIISVNAIALIMLMIGVLYLGQYQNGLINTKLQNFERELIATKTTLSYFDLESKAQADTVKLQTFIDQISQNTPYKIKIFAPDNTIIATNHRENSTNSQNSKNELNSIKILKTSAQFITSLLPDMQTLPQYPVNIQNNTSRLKSYNFPDVKRALNGTTGMSAWVDANNEILLSGAAPITKINPDNDYRASDEIQGAVLIIRQSADIREAIGEVWKSILKIFAITLLVTVFLSIYLAGVIANPLKKLAHAAESVRTGQSKGSDIPDLSHRLDEIGELSIALRTMTDALWARMDSIESFAADVSHELKNPLTSLKSAIETYEKVTKKADQKRLLEIIHHDIARMDRLITDISISSRLDSELSKEAFQTLNLGPLLKDLLNFYKAPLDRTTQDQEQESADSQQNIATYNDVKIVLSPQDLSDFQTRGTPERLKQVFQNLISNALSFSKPGDTIQINITKNKNIIIINVDDEGPGIPDKKLDTIFDRFYTERPPESYGQNSGLGLSICKQIIESHRGEIFAENRRNASGDVLGARFTVILKAI